MLASVLAVVYLVATEAHAPTGGDAVARVDLEAEAIRLARLLARLTPDEPEALSLLALLLLTSARTSARTGADGNPVTLAGQDRTRWNRAAIAEGSAAACPGGARVRGRQPADQIQAHPPRPAADRSQLGRRRTGTGSLASTARVDHRRQPGGGADRAVAVTERDGPEAGLAALKTIAGLQSTHIYGTLPWRTTCAGLATRARRPESFTPR